MRRFALVVILMLLAPACSTPRSAAGLLVIPIELGDHKIKAEIVRGAAEQTRGLMYRREMDWNKGMLFVYPDERVLSFWMKNTLIPLSIAFIDAQGEIVHIVDMKPQELRSHRSPQPVLYALEMNQGWFEKAGVAAGDRAVFELPAP
jgi:uncharacterized membrane protein (UPF0127 family)